MRAIATWRTAACRGDRRLGHDRESRARRDEVADQPDALDLDRNAQRHVFGLGGDVDLVAQRVPDGRQDQAVLRERGERNRLGHTEIEVGRQQADERFVAQVLDDEPGVGDGFGHDRERELALGDFHGEPLRRAFGQPQRHARRDARDLGDERRHQPRAHRPDDAERRVAGLEPLQHGEVAMQRVELAADRPRPLQHLHAELRGHRAPPIPHDELHAEVGFELAHVLGDVRLHRVEAIRGGGERALFGDRQQRLELPDVHADVLRPADRSRRPPIRTKRAYRNSRSMLSLQVL